MVSGSRAKTRKGPSIQVDYLVQILEIKPWPPSQSLKSVRAILIQWENGDRSGTTSSVVPSLGTGAGDGRIEFNESFKLPVTLLKEISVKNAFQKNCIEFNLYEPRREKTVKGQLLGTAIVNLAEYGVVKDSVSVSVPINCTRSYRNTAQPLLFLKIHHFEKGRVSASSRDSLTREASIDRAGVESVSEVMSEDYAEEAEVASFTDDDHSSHSSVAASSGSANGSHCGSLPQGEDVAEGVKSSPGRDEDEHVQQSEEKVVDLEEKQVVKSPSSSGANPTHSSTDLSTDLAWVSKKIGGNGRNKISTSNANDVTDSTQNSDVTTNNVKATEQMESTITNNESGGEISTQQSSEGEKIADESRSLVESVSHLTSSEIAETTSTPVVIRPHEEVSAVVPSYGSIDSKNNENYHENGQESGAGIRENYQENEQVNEIVEDTDQCKDESIDDAMSNDSEESDMISASTDSDGSNSSIQNNERSKHVQSVRSSGEIKRVNGSVRSNQTSRQDGQINAQDFSSDKKDQKVNSIDTTKSLLVSKIQKLEQRVKMVERELREAAATEVGLYSVVAEHGSSTSKVHAPARRLSRFYFHACKEGSPLERGNAAKSVVSGLILVARACGNDVARLTFWLSNSVVLRAMVSKFQMQQHSPLSNETLHKKAVSGGVKKTSPSLNWESFSSNDSRDKICESFGNWADPRTFTRALQKTEAWIFSRIIESIWWQTLTPPMQSGAAKAISRSTNSPTSNVYPKTASSGDRERGSFSAELWKKAFKDACERICPVRAGGHECGCLRFLSKMIMEQCVARLDVAMFNAILRESADDIPSDPISDPISDVDVLPIPPGMASFGAGAQLKNMIGNWSRWLTDLFDIDDGEALEDVEGENDNEQDGRKEVDTSAKSFYLLNALSDLMMLPKDMLLSRTVRKEVCPAFGPLLIKRVLNIFSPDEFCCDPVPEAVLEALDKEDPFEAEENSITNYPCAAAPVAYIPPPISIVGNMLGDVNSNSQLTRSGSSVLKKSYTSDEELEQLDSPLNFIIGDGVEASPSLEKLGWKPLKSSGRERYKLLREVWINSE